MSSGKWRPFRLGLNMLTQLFWCWERNIPALWGQYPAWWCPGSWSWQSISRHDIGCVWQTAYVVVPEIIPSGWLRPNPWSDSKRDYIFLLFSKHFGTLRVKHVNLTWSWCMVTNPFHQSSDEIEKSNPRGKCSHSRVYIYTLLFSPWASCQIRTIAGCACTRKTGNVFPTTAHQQAWYWLCMTDSICCCSRDNSVWLAQTKSVVRFKMWLYFFVIFKTFRHIKSYLSCYFLRGPLARYVQLRVAHALGRPATFSPPQRISDPDMHHGTWHTCRNACRDRWLAVSFEIGGGENAPGIPSAYTIRNFTHRKRDPWGGLCSYDVL